MSYQACEDCGTKMYSGFCPNCNEEVFIEQEYKQEGLPIPATITELAEKQKLNPALPWRK